MKSKVRSPDRTIARIRNRSERRIKRWRRELRSRIGAEREAVRARIDEIQAALDATRISPRGVDFVADFEGFVDHAYKPVASEQFWTIGFGHYGPDVSPGDTISREAAERLLDRDLDSFEAAVRAAVDVELDQGEFDALVSFAFNVGAGAFSDSTLVRKLNAGDRNGAADEFPRWINGASGPLAGLIRRRAAERHLFLTGNYS